MPFEKGPCPPREQWREAFTHPDSGLTSTTRLVLWALSARMNMVGGKCFPSIRRDLAQRTALDPRTVREHITIAERQGWIERKRRGPGHSYDYQATLPRGWTLESGRWGAGARPAHQEHGLDDFEDVT